MKKTRPVRFSYTKPVTISLFVYFGGRVLLHKKSPSLPPPQKKVIIIIKFEPQVVPNVFTDD